MPKEDEEIEDVEDAELYERFCALFDKALKDKKWQGEISKIISASKPTPKGEDAKPSPDLTSRILERILETHPAFSTSKQPSTLDDPKAPSEHGGNGNDDNPTITEKLSNWLVSQGWTQPKTQASKKAESRKSAVEKRFL